MSEKELERRIDVLLTAIEKAQFFINYTKTCLLYTSTGMVERMQLPTVARRRKKESPCIRWHG